jgi:hypothetical protein
MKMYEFMLLSRGSEMHLAVSKWFQDYGYDHWFTKTRTPAAAYLPGLNRREYRHELIVGVLDEDVAIQFRLAFGATPLDEPYITVGMKGFD